VASHPLALLKPVRLTTAQPCHSLSSHPKGFFHSQLKPLVVGSLLTQPFIPVYSPHQGGAGEIKFPNPGVGVRVCLHDRRRDGNTMKVRVKYSNTQKFVVTLEEPNLGNLKEEIRKFVESTYGGTVKEPLTVSLNGSDALTGSADTPLQNLGIVPGDLIKVIPPSAPAACAAAPQRVPSPPKRQATAQPYTSTSASDSRPSGMEGSSGGASGDGPSATSSAKSEQPERKVVETPVSLLIEAKDGCPPPSLMDLFSKCSPTSPSQAVNLMVHLTMLECGFCLEGNAEAPPGWKEMVATIHYSHNTLPEFMCTLVLVTMGEVKQVMASFQQQESEISVKLMVGEYVKKGNDNIVMPENLIRVAQLARTLRNQLLHPLQVAAHQILGVPAPWHLAGLPQELLLMIGKNLDAKSILSLGQSCKRLHSVMEDKQIVAKSL
ncbi:F-box protein 7, partial [Penaeus vannamei]